VLVVAKVGPLKCFRFLHLAKNIVMATVVLKKYSIVKLFN
jgi:hypothetical protein